MADLAAVIRAAFDILPESALRRDGRGEDDSTEAPGEALDRVAADRPLRRSAPEKPERLRPATRRRPRKASVRRGNSDHLPSVNLLFEEIAAAKAAGKYLQLIRQLNKSKVLVLDDFGLRSYTHEEATALVDLLEDRYQRGVVVVTSQVDPRGWLKLCEDAVVGEAIFDRLIHPSQRVVPKGGSHRERLSKKVA